MIILPIILVLIGDLIGAYGAILLKKGSRKKSIINSKIITGFSFYGISTVFFLSALRMGELSFIYPFVSITYIFVSLFSIKFLKEEMNLLKWVSVILIVFGVSLIGLS